MTLILVNIYAKVNFTPVYWDKLKLVMLTPFNITAHVELAKSFWNSGKSLAALNELVYAETLKTGTDGNSRVLGISTTDPEVLLKNWRNLPQNLAEQYNYWQGVVSEKSDYRDAFLQLTALAYRLNRPDEASKYLSIAQNLDRNSKLVQKITEILAAGN